jgi:hypothetical protein
MTHFESLGFPSDRSRVEALFEHAVTHALREDSFADGEHRVWRDASGAAIVVHTNTRGEVECAGPFFEADEPTLWRVRSHAPAIDPECIHCSGADCDLLDDTGELVTRATVQWRMFARSQRWLDQERTYSLRVVAFAHELELFADDQAFAASQQGTVRYGAGSFIPVGMFGGATMAERACAMFAGRVSHAVFRRNELGGELFAHLRIETLPGAVDVVASRRLVPELPVPGRSIAWVRHAWLVGEPA